MQRKIASFKKIALIVLTTFGFDLFLHAQDSRFYFSRFTPANGLSSSEINALFQDSEQTIWIGHKAGISRYDGYQFENLLFADDQRVGHVYAIAETSNTVWIAAEEGLFFYKNKKLEQFKHGLPPTVVYSLTVDDRNRLWFGTANSFAMVTSESNRPIWFEKPEKCGQVKFISVPDTNNVYISDGYSIFRCGNNKSEIIYTVADRRDYISGLIAPGNHTLCISSQLSGFRIFRNGIVEDLHFSKGIGNGLSFSNNRLLYFAVEGIYTIDYRTRLITQLISIPEQYREWGSAVWEDGENNLWIGTHEELLLARPRLFNYTSLPDLKGFDELYSVYKCTDGSLLFGANRGKIFKQKTDLESLSLWKQVFPLAEVFDIHITGSGDAWFCSGYQGLSLLRHGKIQRFTISEGLRSNSNYKFMLTKSDQLFVCGDNGVTRIITAPSGTVTFKNYQSTTDSSLVISCMLEKPNGGLLLGSDDGLLELKNESIQAVSIQGASANPSSVTDIKQDASGNIWISTVGDGILVCRFEPGTNNLVLIKKISVADGLSTLIYLQLFIDNTNTIWAAGYNGVARIKEKPDKSFSVNSFGHSHGFPEKSYHALRMIQDKEGMMRMATSSGLISFNPAALSHSIKPPVIRFDDISFPPGKEYAIKYAIKYAGSFPPPEIRLPYNFGSIRFHFTGIYLSDPSSVRYTFRLIGHDSTWKDAGTERTAVFQNLSPGVYTFQAKASIGNTIWSSPVTCRFTVMAPFWQRWWFILGSTLTLLALLFFLVRRREQNIRKKEAEKTEIEKLKRISYQYQLEIEQVVNYFATVISQQKNIDAMLWDVTRNCISKLGFEDCVIYLKEELRNVLIQKAAWGPKSTEENKIVNPIEILSGKGIVGTVAITGKPEIIADTRKDNRYIVDDIHRLSEITVPIISDGQVLGIIDSEHSFPNFYTERHLQILTTIAALCADKINTIKAEEKTRAKEIEVIKLNSDLLTSQLTALRSQMNPHFIFNSLNSIAQLVASMQNEKGLEYLNKFASLFRLILEESENNSISLKDEIRLLELYLQLESLRFGSSFIYNINTDDSIDTENTLLPSFIIHPIVENAIWHGLLHKQGDRRLMIVFTKKNEGELLCIVKDNGIGVAAARAIKQKSPATGKQQSRGLQMVLDRLHILGQEYNTTANIIIEELKENGFAGGTKVTIHLPVIYDL